MKRSIVAGALALLLVTAVRAQQVVPAQHAPKPLCFRGRPMMQCRAFLLTEFDVSLTADFARWELGAMRNVGPRSAVGVSLVQRVGGRDAGKFYESGVTLRLRRWLRPALALDVSPGIMVAGSGAVPGFTGHVGLSLGDLLALSVLAETVPPDFEGGKRIRWSAGARVGAHLGTILGVLIGAWLHGCRQSACVSD